MTERILIPIGETDKKVAVRLKPIVVYDEQFHTVRRFVGFVGDNIQVSAKNRSGVLKGIYELNLINR